ncbi:hypothetical protein [Leptolyngbya sp. FACHB-261]|uniref:hypothetical protein n=1 Tax=Leptolyngbya sp. FACHB-261 TaxID=2692806 RepID=UPI0016857E0B|nr:hypothetical protein [Leptolyngbya sp. FACHB-261]MBD2100119.1 hypothetical protein [Leptolyngbya sp. FACHB-261]
MEELGKYRFACTLSFGDIYGQIIVWLIVVFVALATSLALGMSNPLYGALAVGLVIVLSLPFLLFAFVTTLFNHIEIYPKTSDTQSISDKVPSVASRS